MSVVAIRPVLPAISEDEFAVWKDDPVTQGVLETLALMAAAQKQAWLAASWDGGNTNPVLLAELRTRADAFAAFAEGSYADFFGVEE
jgi:hypothetical protein